MEFESEEVKQEFLSDYDALMAAEKEFKTIDMIYKEITKKKKELQSKVLDCETKLVETYEVKVNPNGKVVGKKAKTVMTFTGDVLTIGEESIYL